MKQEVSPGVIAVVVVALVAVIGFFAYKSFGSSGSHQMSSKEQAAKDAYTKSHEGQPLPDYKHMTKDQAPNTGGGSH